MSRQFKNSHYNNKTKREKREQSGGSGSSYSSFWYSPSADPRQLSNFTLKGLANTPMFNPLKTDAAFATPTSGVIPTGIHLANSPSPNNYYQSSKPLYLTGGGGKLVKVKNSDNDWTAFAKVYANRNDISYSRAIVEPECKALYRAYSKMR